jgi:peptidoglycan/LPS O-acetylase OafA/YrhL
VPLARNRAGLLLIVTGAIQIFVLLLRYVQIIGLEIPELTPLMFLNRSWLFTTYVFWFSFGIVAGFHLQQVKLVLNRLKKSFPVLMVIFFILGVIEWEYLLRLSGQEWIGPSETLIDQVYSGAVILAFLLFEKFNPPMAAQLAELGSKSYGVYLIHAPVLEYSARLVYHVLPGILAYEAIFQPVLIVLGLGVPLLMMAAVNRSPARMLYKTVFG